MSSHRLKRGICGLAFILISIFAPVPSPNSGMIWGQVAPPPETLPEPNLREEIRNSFIHIHGGLQQLNEAIEKNSKILERIEKKLGETGPKPGAGAATPAADDQEGDQPTITRADKVHVILICDTQDSDLGVGFGAGQSMMSDLLADQGGCLNEDGTQLNPSVMIINGALCRASIVRNRITSSNPALQVGKNDTVFCYIACHGYFSPSDGQIFDFFHDRQQDRLLRSRLFGLLKSLGARQTILISDSCTAFVRDTQASSAARAAVLPSAVTKTDYLCMLLYFGRGDISISACEIPSDRNNPGQFSWYPTGREGIFTTAFVQHAKYLPPKPGRVVNWNHFFQSVQNTTRLEMEGIIRTTGVNLPIGYRHINRADVRQIPTWVLGN